MFFRIQRHREEFFNIFITYNILKNRVRVLIYPLQIIVWQCSYLTLELATTNPPTSSGKPISTNISAPAYLSLTIIGDPRRSMLQIVVQAVAIKTYRVRCAKLIHLQRIMQLPQFLRTCLSLHSSD